MAFNYSSLVARIQIDDSQNIPFTPTPSLQNNTFLYGNRRPLKSGETSLPIPVPSVGYPSYSYYQTYQLPQNLITDPDSLLTYFKACGYEVNYGYSGTSVLNNIGAYSPSSPTTGQVTFYFVNQSLNVAAIANKALTGTFSIGSTSITGSIVSAATGTYSQTVNAQFTGDTTTSSTTISNLNINANLLEIGSTISGTGIPSGSTISTIVSASSITISNAATATATAIALTYISANPIIADTKIVVNSTSYTGLQIGQNLTLNFVAESSLPDVNNTEPFIMNLWQAATVIQDLTTMNTNATVGAPGVYFAILPDSASTNYFQPTGNAMAMGVPPTSVSTSSDFTTLSIPVSADYASFIPFIALGASTITQATSNATGTIYHAVLNGNFVEVQLSGVSGTFNTTNDLTLKLDNTITIMQIQQKYFNAKLLSLRTVPLIYEVSSNSDITTTYSALFNYVGGDNSGLNAPQTANVGQGNCSIIFGNQTTPELLATSTLPTTINDQYYEPVYYLYVQRPGVIYQSVGQTMCAAAMVFACNIYPFNPLNDIQLAGFQNSPNPQDWIDMSVGGTADTLMQAGWNIIASNSNGLSYLFMGRTGQTTINGVADSEFYPSYVLDTKNYYRLALRLICLNNGVGRVRQTDTILTKIHRDIVGLNIQMGNDGILSNVTTNNNLIKVSRSTQNPLGVTIYVPIQQTPGFLFAYGQVANYSINFTLS